MNNNDLLTVLIAFVFGCFAHQMMRNMCRGRLVEGDRVVSDLGVPFDNTYYRVNWCRDKSGTLYDDCECKDFQFPSNRRVCYYNLNKQKHRTYLSG